MDLARLDFMLRRRRMVSQNTFVSLPVIGIQFMSERLPIVHFGLFHLESC